MAAPEIRVVPLGAGQDVGRSCILVSIGGKNVMLDCGMHMGYQDERRFPDFSYISGTSRLTEYLDCVIISHFHLDHCGSLPHMSEVVGYDGPIYMTYPTKAIVPVLLEDYRKVQTEFKGDTNFFTSTNIKNCMKKVIAMNLHETIDVDEELSIRAFYAGHVLGAAMVEVRVGKQSILYTGDYNMTPDRHLGAARILPGIRPDLLISESTYATTIRDSKRARERDFLRKVHDTVMSGGKVLIPVFALGRAQELCILLEQYWERMDLKFPVYFSQGLAERAREYYRLFINWTNEKIKNGFVERNQFDFKHIKALERNAEDMPGPMVLFSTPGMLHGGQSLKVFKKWCGDSRNMIIMPGYCVAGTVGAKVIGGMKRVEIDGKNYDINLGVEYMSFSAHADAKGIMELIRQTHCRHVMFVHGEAAKMEFLGDKVRKEFKIPVHMPANGETVVIPGDTKLELEVPVEVIERSISLDPTPSKRHCPFSAALIVTKESGPQVMSVDTVAKALELPLHFITQSEIIAGNMAMNWEVLEHKLQSVDPELQHKKDGIEMFHGELCVIKLDHNVFEVEVVWEESREEYLPRVVQTSMLEAGQLVSEWLPLQDILPGIERGDLLEFRRTVLLGKAKRRMYTHWAIYIGKLEQVPRVVHISTPDGDFELFTDGRRVKDSFAGFSKILKGSKFAEVRCDTLEDVAGDDLLRINNGMDGTHRPFPPNIIVERATQKLGEGDYNIITNNCEHFCKYCRYGNKISSQAVAAKSIALSSLLAVGMNPGIAIGAGILFAATSHTVSQFLHRRYSTNFRFF